MKRADRVGGVWRDNTYPGAACGDPLLAHSWCSHRTRRGRAAAPSGRTSCATSSEAACLGLLESVTLGTEVLAPAGTRPSARGTYGTRRGGREASWVADMLVHTVGQLSRPSHLPRLPGLGSFGQPPPSTPPSGITPYLQSKQVGVLWHWRQRESSFIARGSQKVTERCHGLSAHPHAFEKPDQAYARSHLRAFERFPRTQGFGSELTRALSEQLQPCPH